MSEQGQASPLKRRVPGATGADPAPSQRQVLPEALIARMQAAVDAAHEAQGIARAAAEAEPPTEPLPTLQAAVASQDWPTAGTQNGAGQRGDAWTFRLGADQAPWPRTGPGQASPADAVDDLAESSLAADPDLTSGVTDDTDLDDSVRDQRPPFLTTASTSGWDALQGDAEPGTDVRHQRAAWWDHAVQSARPGPAGRARQPRPVPAASPATTAPRPAPGRRTGRMRAGVVALAVVVIAGGVAALALISRHDAAIARIERSAEIRAARIKAARIRAAALLASDTASAASWVAHQIGVGTEVACDPVMCKALTDHGFPDQRLDQIGSRALGPPGAAIVVDTPALRHVLGTNLAADWAPTVLAGFGVGPDAITVRVMAPHGAQAYESALAADRKQRQLVGASLLTSSQITTTPAARKALAAGDVDDRLLLVITALASQHPIDIVAFGRTWPGESAGIPMRCAYLADADPAAYLTEPVYVQAMLGLLRVQPPAYRPVNAGLVRLAGRKVLSIWFTAPSPLGLINANP